MEYALSIENAPASVPGGTGILLLHPSTGATDRIDTEFLEGDTDAFLVVSTRTTAREVKQKLEYYDVDASKAVILDTLSVERGYSRRESDDVHYAAAPDDLDGIVAGVERFLEDHDGKLRVTVDSVTEMAYYADEAGTRDAVERILALLAEHDAVGLFHLSPEVHDDDVVAGYEELFDGAIEIGENGSVSARFGTD
jgi:KaiC/GvpD/RAD55 family RecA-like ATPase